MGKQRRLALTVAVVLLAFVVVGCGDASAHLRTATGPATPATEIPIIACPTTHGDPNHYPARFPAQVASALNPSLASQLAYYTDDQRVLAPLLAPRGWRCHAFDYIDGGRRITVEPQGSPSGSQVAVVAEGDNACIGCIWALICPVMRSPASTLGYNMWNCAEKPADERVIWVKGSPSDTSPADDVVRFVDPPGIQGDGTPSGGVITARGLLMYRAQPNEGTFASTETCALPRVDRELCTAILDDFKQRAWGLS